MGRLIAIGDIHGAVRRLRALIKKLQLQKDDKVIFLGDYIDRGAYSKEVIEEILNLRQYHDIVTLRGNHEQMLLDFLREGSTDEEQGLYLYNGGFATLQNYNYVFPSSHLEFINSLTFAYETSDYFFSHAGARPGYHLYEQDPEDLLWIRNSFIYSPHNFGKKIIYGHTWQKEPNIGKVYIQENKIGIDTKAYHKEGRLTAIILPDETFVQVPESST